MKFRYMLLALGLTMGMAQATYYRVGCGATAIKKVTVDDIVICSDFDGVLTHALWPWEYRSKLPDHIASKAKWIFLTNYKIWFDILKIAFGHLEDAEGNAIIGADKYVDYIVDNYLKDATPEDRQAMQDCAFYLKPNLEVVRFYQQLQAEGVKLYLWTNNPEGELKLKIASLNKEITKAGLPELKIDGFYCAKKGTKAKGYAKSDIVYFEDAYNAGKDHFGQNKVVIFVDDKKKYVCKASAAATKFTLPIRAGYFNGKNIQKVFADLGFSTLK